jgi:hypothetical protein
MVSSGGSSSYQYNPSSVPTLAQPTASAPGYVSFLPTSGPATGITAAISQQIAAQQAAQQQAVANQYAQQQAAAAPARTAIAQTVAGRPRNAAEQLALNRQLQANRNFPTTSYRGTR